MLLPTPLATAEAQIIRRWQARSARSRVWAEWTCRIPCANRAAGVEGGVSVSTVYAYQDFAGATLAVPLPVTFEVLDINDIYMAIQLDIDADFENLVPDVDFTRQDLGGGDYTVTTAITDASDIVVRVYRLTTLTQPTSLPEAGPLLVSAIERMADRGVMQTQEVYARLGLDSAGIDLPPGSTFFLPTAVFADNAARAAASPAFLGQLGVQTNTGDLYRGSSLAPAGWTLITGGAGSGTVTSVAIDPSTTGLTFAGGPVTTTGTFTVGGILAGANGGTGVANTGKTITLGGNLTTAGAFAATLTFTATTNATVPAGTVTLVDLASAQTIAGKVLATSTLDTCTTVNNAETLQVLTDAATIAWDASGGAAAQVTISASRTMGAPTNLRNGATYLLYVIQGGAGSWSVTWNAVFEWEGGVAPTLTTTAGRMDILTFVCRNNKLFGTIAPDYAP